MTLFPSIAGVQVRPGSRLAAARWNAPLGPNGHRNLEAGHARLAVVHDVDDEEDPPEPSARFRWQVFTPGHEVWADGYAGSWDDAMRGATWAASWSCWGVMDPPPALVRPWAFLWERAPR